MKIVIVEDEIRIREGLSKLIKKFNSKDFIVDEAVDGLDGYNLIKKLRPDLVITDIKMPNMDGIEMLKKLKDENISFKAVVLSALTEFENAKNAIKLGVCEYLIKPIDISQLKSLLSAISQSIDSEKALYIENPRQLNSLDNILYATMDRKISIDEEIKQFLINKYKIVDSDEFSIVTAYFGLDYDKNKSKVCEILNNMLSESKISSYKVIERKKYNQLVVFLYNYSSAKTVERFFQTSITKTFYSKYNIKVVLGFISFSGFYNLPTKVDEINNYTDWNIVLGEDVMISYPKILNIATKTFIYPSVIEKNMRNAICLGEISEIEKVFEKFVKYFKNEIFNPKEIKKAYVRFVWAIINVLKEIDFIKYTSIEQQVILDNIMNAVSNDQLQNVIHNLLKEASVKYEEGDNLLALNVKKAVRIIQEYYKDGITLDEIAKMLEITPEYLSSQFSKSLNINFCTYIKNHRIQKAKELLIGTELKSYQISKQIGYNDVKYFGRVFKEITGTSPSEYRKQNR